MISQNRILSLSFVASTLMFSACGSKKDAEPVQPKPLPEIEITAVEAMGDANFFIDTEKDWTLTFDEKGNPIYPAGSLEALNELLPQDEICKKLSDPSVMDDESKVFDPSLRLKTTASRTYEEKNKTPEGVLTTKYTKDAMVKNAKLGAYQLNWRIDRFDMNGSQEGLLKPNTKLPTGFSSLIFFSLQKISSAIVNISIDQSQMMSEKEKLMREILVDEDSGLKLNAQMDIQSMVRVSAPGQTMRIARGDYHLTTPDKLKVKIPAVLEKTTPEEWEVTFANGEKRNIVTQTTTVRAPKVVGENIFDYCGMVKVLESRIHLHKENLRPFWLSTSVITEATIR